MPTVTYEIPYENAKEMLLVEEVDNKGFLTGLFDVMYDELPTPKPKKKKQTAFSLFIEKELSKFRSCQYFSNSLIA